MAVYILRRLLLLPLTLFCVLLINFIIINLAPGDPVSYAEISAEGSANMHETRSSTFGADERYLHFREFYGLTLPILFNTWPWLSFDYVNTTLSKLTTHKETPTSLEKMPTKQYNQLRTLFGDQSRFIMPHLLTILTSPVEPLEVKRSALLFFIRGASRQGHLGGRLTAEEKEWNNKIMRDDRILRSFIFDVREPIEGISKKINALKAWYEKNNSFYHFEMSTKEKISALFFESRLMRYMNRVARLDFGTLRNDSSRRVIDEVTKRFKYSLTLSLLPMILTFVCCQFFGILMAHYQHRWPDYTFNLFFLAVSSVPVFVVAPFLIEKVALHHDFPFTEIPIPINGFTSADRIYNQETSFQRLKDVLQHIALPIVAVMYGSFASESRLSRTAFLEILKQDYIRTAKAKGLAPVRILLKHVGKNAAITIVTSLAGSLGIILGGSLIVETLFDINGFGKFFYEAVINRDYNVIMFSALAGSFLTMMGYLMADLAYMWLDPRITLD